MPHPLLAPFDSLTTISPHTVLRFTVLIGGYILLRPLIELLFRRLFATADPKPTTKGPSSPTIGPLRSLADEHLLSTSTASDADVDSDSEGEEEEAAEQWSWGDPARHRQAVQRRRFLEAWEAEQAARAEEEDLADIEDLLEDE